MPRSFVFSAEQALARIHDLPWVQHLTQKEVVLGSAAGFVGCKLFDVAQRLGARRWRWSA